MKNPKSKSQSGYTLLELTVSLSVSLVALGLIFSLVMLIANVMTESREQNELVSELTKLERTISDFFYENNNGLAAISCEDNKLCFTDDAGEKSISFNSSQLEVNGKTLECPRILDLSFKYSSEQKCLKVSIQYSNGERLCCYDFLLCGRKCA